MLTLGESESCSARVAAEPLSTVDEQAAILRAATRAADGEVRLGPGMALAAWERTLLRREARAASDVRGEARTVLRARAAELAVRRWLAGERADQVEAACARLDRTLADIGALTDLPVGLNVAGLESIARTLGELYSRLSQASLGLVGTRPGVPPEPPWRLAEVAEDEFPLEPQAEPSAETREGAGSGAVLARPVAHPTETPFAPEEQPIPAAVRSLEATAEVVVAAASRAPAARATPAERPLPAGEGAVASGAGGCRAPRAAPSSKVALHHPPPPRSPERASRPGARGRGWWVVLGLLAAGLGAVLILG